MVCLIIFIILQLRLLCFSQYCAWRSSEGFGWCNMVQDRFQLHRPRPSRWPWDEWENTQDVEESQASFPLPPCVAVIWPFLCASRGYEWLDWRLDCAGLLSSNNQLSHSGLEGVLRVPGDRKEAQRILTYDLMYSTLKDIIELYHLPVPLLFQCQDIDRLCKTFFNTCDQVSFRQKIKTSDSRVRGDV